MARITLDGIGHAYAPSGHGRGRGRHAAAAVGDAAYALKPLHHVWEQGMAYALLGPSGCGKTTLLNIISGLLTPSHGRLLFDARDVTRLATEQRNIAQVFQFPVIYDTMTVAENLAFPLRNRGVPAAQVTARVAEVAGLLGLTGDLRRRARGLGADAKQKISLGRGLVRADVAAVLFDEPLTVIDPGLKWELRSKLKVIHRALDLLMIYVTHDQTEALTFADRVVVMNDGRVLQIGTPAELFERPDHTFVGHFIGSPGMNLLAATLDGAHAMVAGQTLRLAAPYAAAPAGARVQLGVRPDHAMLAAPSAHPGAPRVQVRRVDDLGRVRLARATLDGLPLVATMPPGLTLAGAEAALLLDPARTHVYVDDRRVDPQHPAGPRP